MFEREEMVIARQDVSAAASQRKAEELLEVVFSVSQLVSW
jgi:hypothetical protein